MLPVHCYCCLLWLQLWLRLKPWLGVHTGALGAHFDFHPKLLIFQFEFSSERAPRIIKNFLFLPNSYLISEVIVNLR
jgi:hypothetical protein